MQKTTILQNTVHSITETYECVASFVEQYMFVCDKNKGNYPPIFLYGEVGVGKTVFVKHSLLLMGVDVSRFSSPTFVFVAEYCKSDQSFFHIDLYRINNQEDLLFYQIDEYIEQGIVFIEWADILPDSYNEYSCYHVFINVINEKSRSISIDFYH